MNTDHTNRYYCKKCKLCGEEYYRNPISVQQFEMLAENANIEINLYGLEQTATITSKCNHCSSLENSHEGALSTAL